MGVMGERQDARRQRKIKTSQVQCEIICLCLDSAYAWILPMPGFRLCLDSAYAWILPMPGFRPCLDFAYAWISPMPGFCPCLDFAYAWIFAYVVL